YRNSVTHAISAQRVIAAGVPQWPTDGVMICTNSSFLPKIVSDDAGGAIVAWADYRSGGSGNIYAQRVSAAGAPQWTADGVALCAAAYDQTYPTITSDGAGGAIVTWADARSAPSAQRVSAAGAPQWTADGVVLSTAPNPQTAPTIVSDGAGGAIVTWSNTLNHSSDHIHAQRVSAAGAMQWTADGVALSTAAG